MKALNRFQIAVLEAVKNGPKTGAEIMKEVHLQPRSLAPMLTSFYKKGLVGCVSMSPITWLITDAGKAILSSVELTAAK